MAFKELRIASLSDVHLLHKKTPTKHILKNLYKYINNDELLSTIDLLIIAGDLFDSSTTFNDENILEITIFFAILFRRCKRLGVTVLELEGTKSHDMRQGKYLTAINKGVLPDDPLDFHYVDKLDIIYIEKLGINVLCVPDEWRHDTAQTLIEVYELLAKKNLAQVDFAIMHGQFEYQMGAVVKDHVKHDSRAYLKLVKHLIFIGHIHQYSKMDRIYAHGSFDRLAHGEEDPKGFVKATVYEDGTHTAQFIENADAKVYKTIQCKSDDLEANMSRIIKIVSRLPDESAVRVMTTATNPLLQAQKELKDRFPSIHWDFDKIKEKTGAQSHNSPIVRTKYQPLIINPDSISQLVISRVQAKLPTALVNSRCLDFLAEVKNL